MHLVQLLDFVFVPFKAVLMQFFKLWISHQALVFGTRTGYVALDCYVFEIRPIHTNPVIQPDGAIDVQGAATLALYEKAFGRAQRVVIELYKVITNCFLGTSPAAFNLVFGHILA